MRLGVDFGTTNLKAGVMDSTGQITAQNTEPMPVQENQAGIQHDPDAVLDALDRLIDPLDLPSSYKLAVTGQRSTFILWTDDGPETPLISWRDTRAADYVRDMPEIERELIREKTGLLPAAGYPFANLLKLFDERPELYDKNLYFGSLDCWFVHRATGGRVHAMSPTQAGRTLLFEPETQQWSADILNRFDLPITMMPEIKQAFEPPCEFDQHWPGAQLVFWNGDQSSATIGGQPPPYSKTRVTLGTGGFLATPKPDNETLQSGVNMTFAPSPDGPVLQAEGAIPSAGRSFDWLADVLNRTDPQPFCDGVSDEAGPLWYPALSEDGTPFWSGRSPALRNFDEHTTSSDLLRGMLMSILLRVRDILCVFPDNPDNEIIMDGGLSEQPNLPEVAAHLWDRPVTVLNEPDRTLHGVLYGSDWGHSFLDVNPYEQLTTRAVEPLDFNRRSWIEHWDESLEDWGLS